MNSFRDIIAAWPTRSAFALDIGSTPQGVTNMLARDNIPARYWATIVDAANKWQIGEISLELLASLASRISGEAA